jgi:hypothetical protein
MNASNRLDLELHRLRTRGGSRVLPSPEVLR